MRRWMSVWLGVAVGFLTLGAGAAKTVKLQGEIVDICYLTEGLRGKDHDVGACLQAGHPVTWLLTEDEKLYTLECALPKYAAACKRISKLAGRAVEVTGRVLEKQGIRLLLVHTIKPRGKK